MRKLIVVCAGALLLAAGIWAIHSVAIDGDLPRSTSEAGTSSPVVEDAGLAPTDSGGGQSAVSAVGTQPSIPMSAHDIESQRKGREAIGKSFTGKPGQTYTVQNVAVEFESLAQKARAGDLLAARTLFEGLANCETAPLNFKRMQQMQAITAEGDARAAAEGRSSDSDPVASQTAIEERFRRCGGLGEDHFLARAEFGRQLADSGDEFARLQYPEWAMPKVEDPDYVAHVADVRTQTSRYLDEELARGNARALRSYAVMHSSPGLGAEDPYRRYLYSYAYAQTPGLSPGDVTYFALAAAESQLNPEQVARAQREGVALFNKCCRRP